MTSTAGNITAVSPIWAYIIMFVIIAIFWYITYRLFFRKPKVTTCEACGEHSLCRWYPSDMVLDKWICDKCVNAEKQYWKNVREKHRERRDKILKGGKNK